VVLAISSPADETNYVTKLMIIRSKKTGKLLFYTIQLGLDSCRDCKLKNNGERCTHRYRKLPGHRSEKNLDIAESILGTDKDSIAQELYGVAESTSVYCFAPYVSWFVNQPRHVFKERVKIIHVFIDPSGAGDHSDFSMAAVAREDHRFVFTGLFTFISKKTGDNLDRLETMTKRFFEDHLKQPIYKETLFYIYLENSNHIFSDSWKRYVTGLFPTRVLFHHGMPKNPMQVGILTTEPAKDARAIAFLRELVRKSVCLAEDRNLISTDWAMKHKDPMIMEALKHQMENYQDFIEKAKTPYGKSKRTFSGKGKNGTDKDDLITCMAGVIREYLDRLTERSYEALCISHAVIDS
jgi:hypothetical protein